MTVTSYSFLDLKDLCQCLLEGIGKQEHKRLEQLLKIIQSITVDEKYYDSKKNGYASKVKYVVSE